MGREIIEKSRRRRRRKRHNNACQSIGRDNAATARAKPRSFPFFFKISNPPPLEFSLDNSTRRIAVSFAREIIIYR